MSGFACQLTDASQTSDVRSKGNVAKNCGRPNFSFFPKNSAAAASVAKGLALVLSRGGDATLRFLASGITEHHECTHRRFKGEVSSLLSHGVQSEELRERLRRMTDAELIEFGNSGNSKKLLWEWKRRKKISRRSF
jgi:hypothetical protein